MHRIEEKIVPLPHQNFARGGKVGMSQELNGGICTPFRISQWYVCRCRRTCRSSDLKRKCETVNHFVEYRCKLLPVVVDLPESTCPMTTTLI